LSEVQLALQRALVGARQTRKRWGQEVSVALFSRVVAQCVRAGLVEGTKIHADSSLVDANASLNSVRELDAATLNQIRRACREQTEKLEETDTKKNEADDDQDPIEQLQGGVRKSVEIVRGASPAFSCSVG
jgi:hypothetical protein